MNISENKILILIQHLADTAFAVGKDRQACGVGKTNLVGDDKILHSLRPPQAIPLFCYLVKSDMKFHVLLMDKVIYVLQIRIGDLQSLILRLLVGRKERGGEDPFPD